jgi:polysaccharide biosynthesis transport protein
VDDTEVISLRDYLLVLRRQRWIVLLVTVLVVVAALVFSFTQTPIYESETELIVDPIRRSEEANLEEMLRPQDAQVETERLVVTSRPVAERAAEDLGIDDPRVLLEDVQVQAVPDTRVVRIVSQHPDPEQAAARSNALAEAYLAHRRSQAVDAMLAGQRDVERRAQELREELEELGGADAEDLDEVELDAEGNPIGDIEAGSDDEVQRQILLNQLSQVMSQASELGEAADAITGGGSILSPGEVATTPVAPRPMRTGALALVLGVLLGVGVAFLRDHVDDVVREENDVKRATGNRPILGRIPTWEDPEGGNRLATVVEPSSLASESYRELSAAVRFLLVASDQRGRDTDGRVVRDEDQGVPARTLMVASAAAGDGKTSTSANLAVAAARVGMRTLLVDCDLRKPTVANRFGLGKTAGLTDLLVAGGRLEDYALDVGIDSLRVLPAGTIPPNPHELLASPAMRAFEAEAREVADLVIYDVPAVLAVPDALELGHQVDHALMVARTSRTGRRGLTAAIERLEQVGTSIAGTVLNGIDSKTEGYYYSYYYAEVPADQVGEDEEVRPATEERPRRSDGAKPTAPTSSRVRTVPAPAAAVEDGPQSPGGDAWEQPSPGGPSERTPWPPAPEDRHDASTSVPVSETESFDGHVDQGPREDATAWPPTAQESGDDGPAWPSDAHDLEQTAVWRPEAPQPGEPSVRLPEAQEPDEEPIWPPAHDAGTAWSARPSGGAASDEREDELDDDSIFGSQADRRR